MIAGIVSATASVQPSLLERMGCQEGSRARLAILGHLFHDTPCRALPFAVKRRPARRTCSGGVDRGRTRERSRPSSVTAGGEPDQGTRVKGASEIVPIRFDVPACLSAPIQV